MKTAARYHPHPRVKSLAAAALLTTCLLVAAALASNELRGLLLGHTDPPVAGATPYLGLTYVPLSHDLAARYGMEADLGVLVTHVEKGSPAAAAGVQRGDVLLSVDAAPLGRNSSLVERLFNRLPGDRVSFQLLRDGKTLTVDLLLGAYRPQ